MTADVVVIGAGPAGAVTAREVARRGANVLLVDRATFPRHKVCGCTLNRAAITTLQRLGMEHVLRDGVPLSRLVVRHNNTSHVFSLPDGIGLSREILDARLIQEAVAAGTEFRSGTTAKLGPVRGAEREVIVAGARLKARGVILATGLSGGEGVAESASRIGGGLILPPEGIPSFYAPGTIFMAISRRGYVGIVRVEHNKLDVAGAFDCEFVKSSGGLGPATVAILGEAGLPCPGSWISLPWKGTPALTRVSSRIADERLFVVGDAAGYVEPFTGEGMAWALMSAAALAPIVARSREWEPARGAEWERSYRQIMNSRKMVCRFVSKALRSPLLISLSLNAVGAFPILSRLLINRINSPTSVKEVVS
jgi:menaquinone-9 beta-reductase